MIAYNLTIYTKEGKSLIELNNTNTKSVTFSKDLNKSSDDWNVTLISLKYDKAIYQPGCVEVELQIGASRLPDVRKLDSLFLKRRATLLGGGTVVAKDYVIFEAIPQYRNASKGTSLYVTLKMYSPDKYLTVDKYCKTYVGKKLATGILETELKSDRFKSLNIKLDVDGLRHLTYEKGEATYEYIQPYLVQYNESFYDLLTRTANRCGEFLFYENGILYLGLPDPETKVEITDYVTVSFHRFIRRKRMDEDGARHRNYYEDEEDYGKGSHYDYNGPADEYLGHISKKSTYEGWEDEALWPAYAIIDSIASALGESSVSEMIVEAGVGLSLNIFKATQRIKSVNEKYNKKYIDTSDKSDQYVNEQMSSEKDEVSLFSSFVEDNIDSSFYRDVLKNEKLAEDGAIHIDLGTRYKALSLGNVIVFNDREYIVTRITGSSAIQQDRADQWTETLEIDAVTYGVVFLNNEGEEAGYGSYDINDSYPFPLPTGPVRKSNPQLAYVAENSDPLRLGRVRIRYPWQASTDEASPWIRVARPMATEGGGFQFIFGEGDEVLVDYENGNVERPYVIGALHSPGKDAPGASQRGTHHLISSHNGHTMHFNDPGSGVGFGAGLLAGLKLIRSFFPTSLDFMSGLFSKKLAGGIDFYDEYGMYSLSMSSDDRSIQIASPLGKVEVSAFTGISIEAPNGNVSITGKNVSITAGNKLTLTSGQNIDDGFGRLGGLNASSLGLLKGTGEAAKGFGMAFASKLAGEVAKLFDLSLIRSIIETFLRPVGGTMVIKSYRYMHLEAGGGEVKTPNDYYGAKKAAALTEDKRKKVEAVDMVLKAAKNHIKAGINMYITQYNRMLGAMARRFFGHLNEADLKAIYVKAIKKEDFNSEEVDEKDREYATHFYRMSKGANEKVNDTWANKLLDRKTVVDMKLGKEMQSLVLKVLRDADQNLPEEVKARFFFFENTEFAIYLEHEDENIVIRKYLYTVIQSFCKNGLLAEEKETTIAVCEDPEAWSKFVDGLSFAPPKKTDKQELWDAIASLTKLKGLNKDQYVWDPVQKGEILFSDKEGDRTVSISEDSELVYRINDSLHSVKEFLLGD